MTSQQYLKSWTEFIPSLPDVLSALNYHQPFVFIRFYARTRTPLLLATGTDRDATSQVWDYAEDCNHRWDDLWYDERINPAKITYGRTLDLSLNPIQAVAFSSCYSGLCERLDYLPRLPRHEGMAVYDTTQLKRVSQNEYWFTGKPLDALLTLFLIEERPRPTHQENPISSCNLQLQDPQTRCLPP